MRTQIIKGSLKAVAAGILFFALLLSVVFGLLYVTVYVLNSDFHGRHSDLVITQAKTAQGDDTSKVTTRLVLHKFNADENTVEASLVLAFEGATRNAGQSVVSAEVHDGTGLYPYGLSHQVSLGGEGSENSRLTATESERFNLPGYVSIEGYPFDEFMLRPIVNVKRDGQHLSGVQIEIFKAFPGRLLRTEFAGGIHNVILSRPPMEKQLVLASAVIFLFLSTMLLLALFRLRKGLTTLEELLAVVGYIVGAASFRDIIGVSRDAGTSALEMVVIGVPMVCLCAAVGFSWVRGWRKNSNSKSVLSDR